MEIALVLRPLAVLSLLFAAFSGQAQALQEKPAIESLEPPRVRTIQQPRELPELAPLTEPNRPQGIQSPGVVLKYAPGTVFYVDATSLALRTGPKRDAILVHYLPKDTRVVAVEDVIASVSERIGSRDGAWIYVQHGEHKGYAFDAFLVAAPPSMQESLDWLCEPGVRVGPITAKTTIEDLRAFFGESNVRDATIPLGEGATERGTVIFAEDDERRLFVRWKYQKISPKSVILEGTRWRTTKGIGIGSRLSELLLANEAPISFAGFGWDYAGFVMSWRGGALESDHTLRDKVTLFLAPEKPYLPADYDALQGDREFSSELPEASRLNLRVSAMTIVLDE